MNRNKQALSYLLVAGGTLLFYMAVLPVVDSLSTWLQNEFNLKSTKLQRDATKLQKEIQDIQTQAQEEPSSVHAIGFQVTDIEEEEEE